MTPVRVIGGIVVYADYVDGVVHYEVRHPSLRQLHNYDGAYTTRDKGEAFRVARKLAKTGDAFA